MNHRSPAGPLRSRVRRVCVPRWGAPRWGVLQWGVLQWCVLLGAVLLQVSPAAAQQAQPLQKSDVIRLLSGGTYSQDEVASMVERSCLSFRPTARDLADFRALGAGDRVMSAVRQCAASGRQQAQPEQRPPVQRPQPQPPPQSPPGADAVATLFLSPRQTTVPMGQEVEVTAELTLGASPVRNARLELRRGTPGEGGGVVAAGITGSDGRARLQIPAADDPGFRWFSVIAVDRPMRGENMVEVRTGALPGNAGASDARPVEEGGSSASERPTSPEEAAHRVGGTAPSEVSPPADSVPLLSGNVAIEDREAVLAEAKRLSLEGRYGHAEDIFRRLVEASSRDVDVLLEYGRHLSRAGRHAEADPVLERAETLAPSHLEILKARAFVKLWLDEPAEAVRRYRRVTELDPGDVEAWRGLARALAAGGRSEEAREATRRAAELATPG